MPRPYERTMKTAEVDLFRPGVEKSLFLQIGKHEQPTRIFLQNNSVFVFNMEDQGLSRFLLVLLFGTFYLLLLHLFEKE